MDFDSSSGDVAPPQRGSGISPSRKIGFLRAVGRHKWVMISTLVASILIAASLFNRQVPEFVSSSRLLFMQSPRSDENTGFGSAAFNGYLRAQAQLLTSSPVLNIAAVKLADLHLQSLAGSADIANSIAGKIQVWADTENGVITIHGQSVVASDSAVLVNTVVDAYQEYASQVLRKSDRSTIQFLQVEKDKHDELLSSAEKQLTQFKALHPELAFTQSNGSNLFALKLAKLNEELTDAQSSTQSLNAKYETALAKIPAAPANPAGAEATASDELDSDPGWLQTELQRTIATISALDARGVPPTDPNLVHALDNEAHLRQRLAICQRAVALSQLNDIKVQVELARQREAELQKAVDGQNLAAANVNAQLSELARLTEESRRAQKASDDVDARLKAISTTADLPPEARVLERARPESSPRDNAFLFFSIAAAAGLVIGSSFACCIEAFDTRLRTPEEAGGLLGLPVVGILPQQKGEPSVDVLGMIAHTDSMSAVADGARRIRAAVFAASRTAPALTIVVTSPASGDGKSVVAANLAIVMAQAGVKTVLIDANFQSPGTAKIFDLQRSAGLSDVIAGRVGLDRAIRRTPVERLEVLSAGGTGQGFSDFLNDSAFAKLISKISESYQCIVLDSPSVMSGPEARILGSNADLTLLVVRTGRTDRRDANQAMDKLLSVGTRVLGTVVNGYLNRPRSSVSRGGFSHAGLSPVDYTSAGRQRDRSIIAAKKSQSSFDQQVDVFD